MRQIERSDNMTIRFDTQVIRAEGSARLEALTIKETSSGKTERVAAGALFVLIGAGPHTAWLEQIVQRDEQGFIRTGRYVVRGIGGSPEWLEYRAPHTLETSMPGVFAVGDVRHRSLRGVTAAVADGAVGISSVREYLAGG